MAKRWRIKPNKDLRENARLVVPRMVDDFLSHRNRVIGHPRLKNELHRMRLAGKTLRYAMEVFEPAFGKEFGSCLEEVKDLLDTMGSVHDCDVNIPRLQAHLREVRLFNRSAANRQDKVPTGSMVRLVREQLALRQSLFGRMSEIIEQWSRKDFGGKVARSMSVRS
jgi:CHAD domain-containing protein